MNPILFVAIAVAVALAIAVFVVLDPGRTRLSRERRRPFEDREVGALADVAEAASSVMGRLIRRRERSLSYALDLAGIATRPQDFAFFIAVGGLALAAIVLLLGGGFLALPVAALGPVGALLFVRLRTDSRRKAFSGQLDGTLQLLASNLRAGYSTMQALGSVARDSEEPTATELARVVNEARVGRPVVDALETAAERMESEDFMWAVQAIAINREVGGSLSEVLDGVAGTIRERGEIRRHVAALAAEGKLSAIILMLLPFVVAGFMMMTSPAYLLPLVQTPVGIALLVIGVIMLVGGGIWMRKSIEVKF